MSEVQQLRLSVYQRINVALEDFLLQVEKSEEAAHVVVLRALLTERLTTAAEEIIDLIEETVANYESTVKRSGQEIRRQKRLLDMVLKPEVKLYRMDVQQPMPCKEETPPQSQQWWNTLMDHEYTRPRLIKEEQEERRIARGREQLHEQEEAEIKTSTSTTPLFVKSEEDEEIPQTSQLQRSQGPELEGNSLLDVDLGAGSEEDTDTSSESEDRAEDLSREIYTCIHCGRCFYQKGALTVHLRTHVKARPFKCSMCGLRFSEKITLTRHMRVHTGEKPFKCVCGRSFSQKGALISHMRLFTGDRPFKCLECGHGFLHKISLVSHMRIHTGEKPFKCPVCDQTFTEKTAHTRHMRIHKGEKPFICPECGQSFLDMTTLLSHMGIHTKEKPLRTNKPLLVGRQGNKFQRRKGPVINTFTLTTTLSRNPSFAPILVKNVRISPI